MSENHFSAPGYYQIKVKGLIPHNGTDRFGAMSFKSTKFESGNHITILQGVVIDQAELLGILNNLYELHLTLLSAQYLGEKLPE